jgi:23S rRNA (cytosine1962-C5)-methyltransferase
MALEGVEGVVERNDSSLRALEGLPSRVGLVRGVANPQIISDGVLRYHVDPLGGQKTGTYLDQRENRIAMRRYMPGAAMLDLFANSGGFALHAAHAGAARVVAVDSSATAVAEIEANRQLNGLGAIEGVVNDVFADLAERRAAGQRFNVVVADPPPFARSRKNVAAARRKYVELFAGTLAVLAPGGFAFWASCSHHITRDTFLEMVRESLARARRTAVVLEERGASPDHPVHPMMPETSYLHGVILRVE